MGAMMPPRQSSEPLSDEQKAGLNALLEDYDSDTISDSDADDIVSGIKDLGISAGPGLASALSDAGFDPQAIGQKGGGDRPPPPPPPPDGGQGRDSVDSAVLSLFTDALEANSGSSESGDWSGLMSTLEEAGIDTSKPIFDFYA